MPKLDQINKIKKLDKTNLVSSVDSLHKQIEDAWKTVKNIEVPENYKKVNKIIICGMGGSSLGGHVIRSLYADQLEVPIYLQRDYNLPKWTDQNTLVVLSSYSGNTEETVSCANDAEDNKYKTLVITSNGELARIAQNNNFPSYQINPQFNPCGQPRMAIGYSVFGQVAMFNKLGLITIDEQQIKNLTKCLKELTSNYELSVPVEKNPAKQIAIKLKNKFVNYISSQHLRGASHVFNNQTNENSKNFSNYFFIPELNHHLMEGLKNPDLENGVFLFFNSKHYSKRIQKRFALTKDVVEKNGVLVLEKTFNEKTKLEDAFHLILFGGYTTFYLSMLNNLNPAPIPWVDYFKEKL
jgi:glucose/mannose-6-phosphate isomerase